MSGFTRSEGLNPDSIQVALSGTPEDENSSNLVENVCLNGFFLESASIFSVIYHKKVISKKGRILSGISQVDGIVLLFIPIPGYFALDQRNGQKQYDQMHAGAVWYPRQNTLVNLTSR